ncbi:hypothetical protein FDP22_19615 (plasmid) [Paroceanicella profunda]|uniref:Uncharacterized protein n=1 Tax=Paroceanicella profunda TaxID=2579971 RepID=A0A5B8FJB8_9RHOB|nr:hypothetical protein [Paroceanicella profunda]QDL94078.1 hypothetical protein FDP22_19615 [Paroceanicella profunda]
MENTPKSRESGPRFAIHLFGSFRIRAQFRHNFLSRGNIRGRTPELGEIDKRQDASLYSGTGLHALTSPQATPPAAHGKAG